MLTENSFKLIIAGITSNETESTWYLWKEKITYCYDQRNLIKNPNNKYLVRPNTFVIYRPHFSMNDE